MAQPLINGIQPSFGSISIVLGGTILTGYSAISYKYDEDIQDVPGAGQFSVARTFNNVTFEGSITLHKNELSALQIASPTGRLSDITEFEVIVTYTPKGLSAFTYDTLKSVRFKNNGVDASQNDNIIEFSVDLAIGDIEFGRI